MASGVELLRFQLPGHEAATLRNMNQLRSEERFCDVTIVADSLKFRGHKVILAACSPFLRDQFLLNPSSELQVSLMHSTKIVADLLLSCYTGALEFAVRDIVNYLTAASYLQMEHVVEKCRNALSQFIEPKISLKEDATKFGGHRRSQTPSKVDCSTSTRKEYSRKRPLLRPIKLEFPLEEHLEMKAEDDDEEQEEDYGDDDAVSDICIVKIESAMEVAQRQKKQQQQQAGAAWNKEASPQQSWNKESSPQQAWSKESAPPPGWNKDASGDQEESQVNSTVAEAMGSPPEPTPEKPQQGVVKACYSLYEDAEGSGLLIIPSGGYLEETSEAAAVASECQSSGGGVGLVLAGLSGRPFSSFPAAGRGSDSSGTAWGSNGASRIICCTKCDEVFQGVEKLVFHMRAHHFIFMCPRCGKQFNHSSNLNRHMNVHRGVKSHSCTICGKCFTQKSTLHDHMNLHSGERPYRCSYCEVRFAHKPAIRRHLKEQHGKTTAENVMEAGMAQINVLIR
ncbi:zinc finger and BTB domain-containing protein 12 [Eublepharis macularius]|uniref:Zinc finger and BTB domain-containing protein 12 n=1 Tax=Eublepharis macularius TaxID=481883 RepID=A0AA97KWC9_EUBMA|nr:zinc finger and BTB domain-containing protein 12 [Eublepharis macularius]